MRHESQSSVSSGSGKFIWAAALVVFLQAVFVATAAVDETTSDDNMQIDGDVQKRDWNKNLNMWGKRGWSNLHGGWGVKRSPWVDQNVYSSPPIVQKRAWKNFQSGWGKRFSPDNEDITMQEVASLLEQNDHQSIPVDIDIDAHDEEKRNWEKFSDGWGKRNKWENFRGGWGKREPAWVNLKGLWGKRSDVDRFMN